MTQHRIYLGSAVPGTDLRRAAHHWWHGHSAVVPDLPLVRGYVQNRLPEDWWPRVPYFTCAETWFDSREDERTAYASDYYRDVVVPDERNVIGEEGSWTSAVLRTEVLVAGPRARYRALCFGADATAGLPEPCARAEVLHLQKGVPGDGAPSIVSVWTDDESTATRVASAAPGLALLTTPVAVVVPDQTWAVLRHEPGAVPVPGADR